jgi:hypothetical protein
MNISNSPDITKLLVRFVIDLSGKTPKLLVENLSEGPSLATVLMAFEAYSPNNVPIHRSTLAAPDTVGNFGVIELPAQFAMFNRAIEFSGNEYRFVVNARDSQGTVYKYEPEQTAKICAPAGNKQAGSHFGAAKLDINVDCNRGEVYVKDLTNYSYAGKDGTREDEFITIVSPADETGEIPAPKKYDGFSQVIHQLSFSGTGFKAVRSATRRYDLGKEVHVIIRYQASRDFDVNCSYDLCPLITEYTKLLLKAEKNCDTKLNTTIGLINAKLVKAIIAKMQPACGYDLPKLIDEIKELGGFDVDCNCSRSTGFNLMGNSTGGMVFNFNTEGDITATAEVNGLNVLIDLKDFSYVFDVAPFGTNEAFKIQPNINGRTKTFTLNVNRNVLAAELLGVIENDQQLLEKLRYLTAANFDFIVDGKGIIQTNERCDQELTIANVPANATFVMLKTLTIDGIVYTLNQSLNGTPTELAKLNARLAALNKGVIVASYLAEEGVLRIATAQNAHKMTKGVMYFPSLIGDAANKNMMYRESNCNNSAPYTPSTIVQAIIDFIMKMTTENVMVGNDYAFCQINADGTVENVQIHRTDKLSRLIELLRNNACRAVNTNGQINADMIKAIFSEKLEKIMATDFIFGTRNGKLGVWSTEDVTREIAKLIYNSNDSTLLADWCAAVSRCYTDEEACNPVSFLQATMGVLQKDNFFLTTGPCAGNPGDTSCLAIAYVGHYIGDVLDYPVTIKIRDQFIATGAPGTNTRDAVMAAGDSMIEDVLNAYPGSPLAFGRRWIIDSITMSGAALTKKYLQIRIKNNGNTHYKVAYRIKGVTTPFTYTTIQTQPGPYTLAVFDVAENDYEAAVIAVCGPGKESAAVTTSVSACPSPITFNAVRDGQNFKVNYKFPAGVTKYNLRVNYPNNGQYDEVLNVADPGTLTLAIPPGVYGNFVFSIRAVCNEETGWFGAFSGQVIVAVAAPTNACPMVLGVEVTAITQNTATITLTVPGDLAGVQGYSAVLTPEVGEPKTFSSNTPVILATGLAANTKYFIKITTHCTGDKSSDPFSGGSFFTQSGGGMFRAFWGALDGGGLLTVDQIEASPNYADFANGADVVADWTYNTLSKYLWVAIPSAQSNKTKWFGTTQNQGNVGPFPETFGGPAPVSNGSVSYDFYISNFKTKQSNTPIEFREA